MQKKEKINFAIIGCGHIGQRHAEHIHNNPEANLFALCDIKPERAKKLARQYQCRVAVKDYEKLLNDQKIDVVNICLPNGLHAKVAIDFLKHQKHVVCEKPICLKEKEGERMIAWAKKAKKQLMTVMQNRYNPPIVAVKNALDKKLLGQIYMCHTNIYWNRNDQYYNQSDWRGTKKMDGGTLFTQCSHFIDLLLWFNGPIKSVLAKTGNFTHPKIEFEDTGAIIVKFKNNALGTINFTTCAYGRNMEGSVYVMGTKGSVRIGGEYLNRLDYWNVEETKKPILKKGAPANDYGFYQGSMSNHDKVIQNVVDVLRGRNKTKTTAEEGLEAVRVINAIYKSARLNKEIYL